MSGRTSGANTSPDGDAKNRSSHSHHDGSSSRPYTTEQKAAVIRVRKCGSHAYYEILSLDKTCSEGEIKKAYRKLSLLTHPDKNGYDGADEAFKMVSRAFQVLSDPDKRTKFDKFGGDPDSRFGGSSNPSASPFSNFSQSGRGGPMFEEEISPEEMFRQFFGGGFGGGPFGFDTGPGFVFNLGGGPGVRVHQFGGGRPRMRPQGANGAAAAERQPGAAATLQSLLPLILLFLLPLLSSIFSGSSSTPSGPNMRFDAAHPPYTQARRTSRLNIQYWVNPVEVEDYGTRRWREVDKAAEVRYMGIISHECELEQRRRENLLAEAQGWFFVDQAKYDEARKMEMKSCKRLAEFQRRL